MRLAEFNEFNDTGARMLDDIKIALKAHFCHENVKNASLLWTSFCNITKSVNQ